MSQLPEELEAMAWLYGQSKALDSMVTEQNSQLVTDSNTIRRQIDAYQRDQRHDHLNDGHAASLPFLPPRHNLHQPPPVLYKADPDIDKNQLEFNLEPTQADTIIDLLKDIKILLGKIVKKEDGNIKFEKKSIPKIP